MKLQVSPKELEDYGLLIKYCKLIGKSRACLCELFDDFNAETITLDEKMMKALDLGIMIQKEQEE